MILIFLLIINIVLIGSTTHKRYGLYINAPLNFPLLSQNAANLSLSVTRTERDNGNEEDAINLYLHYHYSAVIASHFLNSTTVSG